jgi:hypothetical protein
MEDHHKNHKNHDFHGWWHNETIGSMNGFNAGGPDTALQDNYIYIDTYVYPVQIYTTYGTEEFPRLKPNIFDPKPSMIPPIPNVPMGNSFFYKTSCELINGYNQSLKCNVNEILSIYKGNTIKMIDDETISVFNYLNHNYFGEEGLCIYKKRINGPKDTSKLDWNDPINLFKYYVSANRFSNLSTNSNTKEINYVGEEKEKIITDSFFKEGFKRKTLLRKIRITNKKYYSDIGIKNDNWTTIYTGDPKTGKGIFSYVTPGSNVKIKGAEGRLSILNGIYYNGVGLLNAGGNLLLNPEFVDKGPNGSYNDLFNSFLLNLDTSSLKDISNLNTGWIDLPFGITVTVVHTISAMSKYNDFCASCAAWVYAIFKTATHVERNIYTKIESCQLISSFSKLRKSLKNGTANSSFQDSMRYGQPFVSWYYHNFYDYRNLISGSGIDATGGLQNMVNCPYPANYYNSLFKYDVALGNYLINVHYLVFTIRGVLEKDQPNPENFGYPFIYDESAGRAHFESLVIAAKIINGVIQAYVPDNYASMGIYENDHLNINAHYFGQINPILTKGKIVGYIYKRDCKFIDKENFMGENGVYNTESPNTSKNPRIYRESLSAVYSKMMQWFNSINSETIIIDQCGNLGGNPDVLSISEFMGSDRNIVLNNAVFKGEYGDILNYNESNTVAQTAKHFQEAQYLYVSLNEQLYPGSVFKGSKSKEKRVIFLTDIFSRSFGDISPNYFIGKGCIPGYLGSNTQASIVGCLDGREFGEISVKNSFPPNINKRYNFNNFIDVNGEQISPFTFNMDWGRSFLFYSDKKLSMLRQNDQIKPSKTSYLGTSGSNALPINFEETIFLDFGFINKRRKLLSGWKKLHPMKPNMSDPTTWTYLYLDAAISYII